MQKLKKDRGSLIEWSLTVIKQSMCSIYNVMQYPIQKNISAVKRGKAKKVQVAEALHKFFIYPHFEKLPACNHENMLYCWTEGVG